MNKKIEIKCKGNRYLPYNMLKSFQSNLKLMSKESALKLRQSILNHGWIAPVFVWNKNYIIDGHGRLLILGELIKEGYSIGDLPIVDIEAKTKKEAAQILLAINSKYQNITDDGLYEFMNEMDLKIEDMEDFELPDIDMEKFELGYFSEGETEDDEVPALPEKAKTKLGDLYTLGSHRLLCGDATKKEDVEKLMDGKKADMIFTDPPYGVSYANKNKFLNAIARGNRIQTPIKSDHGSLEDMQTLWLSAFSRAFEFTKKGGCYYICGPQGKELMMMMMMMIRESQWKFGQTLIWVKNNHVLGRSDYNYKHEPIFYGWKEEGHKFYGSASETSVWEIARPFKSDLHPTMKPIALIERAILNSSLHLGLILDPFLGSGSTLIACEKTNRICYGMEIDPHYCDVIVQRWCDYTGKTEIDKNGKTIEWKLTPIQKSP